MPTHVVSDVPVTLYLVYFNMEFNGHPGDRVAYFLRPFTVSLSEYHDALTQNCNLHGYAHSDGHIKPNGDALTLGALFQGKHPRWFTEFCSDEGRSPIGSKLMVTMAFKPSPDVWPEEALERWIVADRDVTFAARCAAQIKPNGEAFTRHLMDSDTFSARLKKAIEYADLMLDVKPGKASSEDSVVFNRVEDVSLSIADVMKIRDEYKHYLKHVERFNEAVMSNQAALEAEVMAAWDHRIAQFEPGAAAS